MRSCKPHEHVLENNMGLAFDMRVHTWTVLGECLIHYETLHYIRSCKPKTVHNNSYHCLAGPSTLQCRSCCRLIERYAVNVWSQTTASVRMTPVQVTKKQRRTDVLPGVVETQFFLTHRLETSASRQENQDRRGKELIRQVRHVLLMRSHPVR